MKLHLSFLCLLLIISCKPEDPISPKQEQDDKAGIITTTTPSASNPQANASDTKSSLQEDIPIEEPPLPHLTVSVCDRTAVVRNALIEHFKPWWAFWKDEISCEDLDVSDLEQIEELDLSEQNIIHFKSDDLADLPSLKELDISDNLISSMKGSWFSELSNLEELILSNNRLRELDPNSFLGLVNLKILRLEGNKIAVLPEELIAHMSLLEGIDLSNNLIENLPTNFFYNFQHLKSINLQNNLFKAPVDCGVTPVNSVDRACHY